MLTYKDLNRLYMEMLEESFQSSLSTEEEYAALGLDPDGLRFFVQKEAAWARMSNFGVEAAMLFGIELGMRIARELNVSTSE